MQEYQFESTPFTFIPSSGAIVSHSAPEIHRLTVQHEPKRVNLTSRLPPVTTVALPCHTILRC